MKLRPLTLFSSFSLLIGVAAAVLWVRSYWVEELILRQRVDGGRWARTAPGYFVVGFELLDWSGYGEEFFGVKYLQERPRPVEEVGVLFLVRNMNPGDIMQNW